MKPMIIAEVGINANGSIDLAKKLIKMAHDCGCDAVKFQKRDIDTVYTKEMLDSHRESPWGDTQRDQKLALEFGQKGYEEINRYCEEIGILWFASAWDIASQRFLQQFNLPYNKIASAMITYKPLLEEVAREGKHTFISTGMATFEQIDEAVEIFREHGTEFTLMHCVSEYPCPDELCNVSMIRVLKHRYDCLVGYSGHEKGITPSLLAIAYGASVIERHVTLDRSMYGSDQSASLEKRGLEILVRESALIEDMIGKGHKDITDKEKDCAKKLRWFEDNRCLKG